ncbi:MAG: type II toxin-antitoxin system HicA family toxin [Planctomycetota bacterium]
MTKKLRKLGFAYDRPGPGSHEIWRRESDGRKVTLPRHSRDMAEGTLRAVLREASIEVEVFLDA